ITRRQIEKKIGGAADRMTAVDIANLRVVYQSIRRGEVSKDEEFQPENAEDITASLKGGKKGKAAAEPETVGEMIDQMPAAEADPPAEPEGDYVAPQPEIDPETGEIAEGKPEEPSDDLKALHAELMAGLRNE